jgi:hypothetical protein
MSVILLAVAPLTAFAIVMGTVIGLTRLVGPKLGSHRPICVVDHRTYRDACSRVERMIADGDYLRAHHGITSMRTWLRNQVLTGRTSHRVARAAALEQWELRDETVKTKLGL